MKRKKSLSVIQRNQSLLCKIAEIKYDHPLCGYRRVWAYLKYCHGVPVNRKRIYRIMKKHNMLITPLTRLKTKRCSTKPKPVANRPNQFWGIDMTKIRMHTRGWLYLTVVLDWYTKKIADHPLSMQSKTDDWLNALESAVNSSFPNSIRDAIKENQLFLISDNGCQPTSQKFMMSCSLLGIKQIFTTWSKPNGNSDTELVMRTIKKYNGPDF